MSRLHHRAQRLSVSTINYGLALRVDGPSIGSLLNPPSVSQVRVGGVCRHKRMRLRRYWRENALLVKTKTVGASPVRRRVESMATNLEIVSGMLRLSKVRKSSALPFVSYSNGKLSPCAALELAD